MFNHPIFFLLVSRKWGGTHGSVSVLRRVQNRGVRGTLTSLPSPLPTPSNPSLPRPFPSYSLPCHSKPSLIFPNLLILSSNEQPGGIWTHITESPCRKLVYILQQNIKACGNRTSVILSSFYLSDGAAFSRYLLVPLSKFNVVLLNPCFPGGPITPER